MINKSENYWDIYDKFYNCHWMVTGYSCRKFCDLLKNSGIKNPKFLAIMENDTNSMCFIPEQFEHAANYYTNKTIQNPTWRKKQNKIFLSAAKKFWQQGEYFLNHNLSNFSNRILTNLIKKILPLHESVRVLGVTHNGIILDSRNHLSNEIKKKLLTELSQKKYDLYWSTLSKPIKPSLRQKKLHELFKLKKEFGKSIPQNKLKTIHKKFAYLDYMYYGPLLTIKNTIEEYKNLETIDPYTELKLLSHKQKQIIKRLKLTRKSQKLIKLSQEILWLKGFRKDIEYHGFLCYAAFFEELSKRFKLNNYTNLFYLLPWEIEQFINGKIPNLNTLVQRRKFSVFLSNRQKYKLIHGKKAHQFFSKQKFLKFSKSQSTELKGLVAYLGKTKGKVKLIFTPKDMVKMKQGDILVSQATSPNLLPAMKKASAIVTNTGGLICHAAITARELKIPCIVGTIYATKVLKDGDLIEVNANTGIIRLLKKKA